MQASTARLLGLKPEPQPLRDAFLRWQCRVRQMMMRDKMGRPDAGIMPALTLPGGAEALVEGEGLADAQVRSLRVRSDLLELPNVCRLLVASSHERPEAFDLVAAHVQQARSERSE